MGSRKKSSKWQALYPPPLIALPLRRKKELFFFILLPFKNKNNFTLDNLSKYGHITLNFVGRYFYLVVTIFSK